MAVSVAAAIIELVIQLARNRTFKVRVYRTYNTDPCLCAISACNQRTIKSSAVTDPQGYAPVSLCQGEGDKRITALSHAFNAALFGDYQQQQKRASMSTGLVWARICRDVVLDSLVTVGPLGAVSSHWSQHCRNSICEQIPLITDENYAKMIVNETLTPKEKERVWFLIIWKGELSHRGQTLRFYKASHIRLTDEILHQFLKEKAWSIKEPWKSIYGSGGEREYILDYLAQFLSKVYGALIHVPKWLMSTAKPVPKPVSAPAPPEHAVTPSVTNTSQKGRTKRKGKK
ncbi:hypothetical protein F4604DRAFT_1694447 [Suillus subluteus]|nr:hypothetical protein F4604DRAFT_1694447 [Suillus subluteus]